MDGVYAQPVGCGVKGREDILKRPPIAPVASYGIAIVVGSLSTGGVLFLLGSTLAGVSSRSLTSAMAVLAVIGICVELTGRVRPLPESHAQVPRRWTTWRRPWMTAAAFGFVLGMGVFTLLHHATVYVLAALIMLAPSFPTALAIAAVYGATRGLLLFLTWLRKGRALIDFLPASNRVTVALAAIATLTLSGALLLLV